MAQLETPTIASDGLPARSTGPWVHDKNYYLQRYLEMFTRGVGRKWAGKLSYTLPSGRRSALKNELTEPTLLEMFG